MIKNFFNISDLNKQQLENILNININTTFLRNKNIGLIFEKYSTRTRLSFSVAIANLCGNRIDIRFEELNISREESFEDTFKAMNCYLDGLVYRTDDHQKLIRASKYFNKPIINALSDISHPCQILSDLYTLKQKFGSLKLNILWMGDMNNVSYSLYEAAKMIKDLNIFICSPRNIIESKSWEVSKNIKIIDNIDEIELNLIDCVMTDVFISMNDEIDTDKLEELGKYKVTSKIMNNTKANSVFMHCLPAKIGSEVDEDVINGEKSIVWTQAKNRMIAQMKLMQCINW